MNALSPETLPARATVNQVAEAMNVSHMTIRRWISEGFLTGYRKGHVIRISRDSVLAAEKKMRM